MGPGGPHDCRIVTDFSDKLHPVKSFALHIAAAFAFALVQVLAQAQAAPGEPVPATLRPPAGENLLLRAHASGWQIYVCSESGGKAQWTLKAPDADLHDVTGKVIGHHFAGPTWKAADGSEVTGKAVAHVDSPDAKSIPWLLLTATGHAGAGTFAKVTSIRRVNTHGGVAPSTSGCDASKAGAEARSAYTADYEFYAPVK